MEGVDKRNTRRRIISEGRRKRQRVGNNSEEQIDNEEKGQPGKLLHLSSVPIKKVLGCCSTARQYLNFFPNFYTDQINNGIFVVENKEKEYRYLGDAEYNCPSCGAIMWFDERIKNTSTRNNIRFNMCCRDGKVRLKGLKDAPDILRRLLTHEDKESKDFRQLIRVYNSCYAFTSMGAKIDNSVNQRPGSYVFRVSGQVLHRMGTLLPEDGAQPSYAQLYIYDTDLEISLREKAVARREDSPTLDRDILAKLKDMLDEFNPLAKTFRMAKERIKEDDNIRLSVKLLGTRKPNDRIYNTPTTSEIAALIVQDNSTESRGKDIVVHHRSRGLQEISELHPSYMALQYPLLFPYGEDSYHTGITYYVPDGTRKKGKREYVTMREYYAYRIQQREEGGGLLLYCGRLFQQFLVDCCCAIESERLWFIRNNQDKFRCDVLNNVYDAITQGDTMAITIGKRIYLPLSFTGSPRYMQQNYQDAMAICRWYGNPHLFLTLTANPRWPEVEAALTLMGGQKAEDRPDIVARVFKMKLRQLMHLLKKEDYFGPTVADIYTIEFQKRGLPHAHILLWLRRGTEEVSTDFIDTILHAEIPDKNKEPRLYEIVSRSMVHGPCGKDGPNCPCMMNDVCTKKYPKEHNESTTLDHNGYPVYRRRKDSRTIKKGIHEMDNRSIVTYNPGLLLMFDAHINVEWCNTAKAIKYLFKYISKGPDKATLVIQEDTQDEIKAYMDCRYLSASEAAKRIFEFDIQERYPSVMRLPVHLEGEQSVVIKDSDMLEEIIEEKNSTETMMTAWMATNANQPDAKTLSYAEFPTKYAWKEGRWHKRKQGKCIGRMVYVHPIAGEKYYLRVLLNIVKGAQSYQEIRTLGDVVYPTFKEACYVHGLLNNDKEWYEAMSGANKWAMPSQLRELFVTMILFCEVTDITKLWDESYGMLSEDIERKKRRLFGDPNFELSDAAKRSYTLLEIDKILMRYGKRLSDIESMPQPVESDVHGMENRLIRDERKYDRKQLRDEWEGKVKLLNTEQKVINAASSKLQELFFVYGHGGTRKTFLYGAISAKLRSEGKIVLNVASSATGIAALLLPGGRTAHSRFDIPIELFDDSTCNVKQNSQLAELLRETSLIIWDEAPMDHKNAFEALDRTMRDIVSYTDPDASSKMFGGKVVLLGGDFRQVLPIVSKGKRQDILQASISRSHIWKSCTMFILRKSMRVTDSDGQRQRFNKWLLAMGDGRLEAKAEEHEDEGTWIKIPEEYTSVCGKLEIKQVVDEIYPSFVEGSKDDEYLRERAILTPLNELNSIYSKQLYDRANPWQL
ncbi:uncharacterized protein LOC141655147 [Silene latifolia]|uniref:uncharacterized protein LOC141655147 n=1 Tax=Silene latifolia TaxID=37657 RepID=UPI003D782D69